MALPTSGVITLSEIKTEFSGPDNLTAYYRGGTYVPNISQNDNVPTSGVITITDFYNATTSEVVITSETYSTEAEGAENAGTQLTFEANGVLQLLTVAGTGPLFTNISGQWLVGGTSTPYTIEATLVTSNLTGTGSVTGTFGSIINLNTSPTWYVTAPTKSIANANILFQIRTISPDVVVASAYISLYAIQVGGGGTD